MVETQTEQDTQPVAALRDHAFELIAQVRSTGRPLALTHDGQVEAVLLDPAEYEQLIAIAEHAQAEEDEALRRGAEDIRAGRTRPIDDVFDEIRKKYALPR